MARLYRLLLALCAFAGLAAAHSPPAQASLKMMWGPSELPDGSSAFPVYRQLGVDVLQHQLSWRAVATARPADPRDPADPAYQWPSALDAAVAEADQNGIHSALLVKQTPDWANGGRGPKWVPTDVGDYADFLVAASRRYGGVRHWMIWGEPTRGDSFEPMPAQSPRGPRAYARLLDRAYVALKGVRRSNIVIGGNTWTVGVVLPPQFIRWMRLPNGKPPRLDYYGHNPFSARFPMLSSTPFAGIRDMSDVDTLYRDVKQAYRGHKTPRLWLSEFTVSARRANRAFSFFVNEREQARWLTAAYRIAHRERYIAGLGWYTLLDEPDPQQGLTSGLLDATGKPNLSFYAYRRARR
jgi:hypothetical protein